MKKVSIKTPGLHWIRIQDLWIQPPRYQNFIFVIEYLNGSLQVSLDARWGLVGDLQAGLRQGGRELGVGFGGQPVGNKYLRLALNRLPTDD